MKTFRYAGMILALTMLFAAVGGQAQEAETADITVAELKQAMAEKKVTLLDCNGSASYAKGHLPGAIDFSAAGDKLASMLPADKSALIVAYCGGPKCLAYRQGIEAARKLGYTKLKHYSGGLSGWRTAGETLDKK